METGKLLIRNTELNGTGNWYSTAITDKYHANLNKNIDLENWCSKTTVKAGEIKHLRSRATFPEVFCVPTSDMDTAPSHAPSYIQQSIVIIPHGQWDKIITVRLFIATHLPHIKTSKTIPRGFES